MSVWWVMEVLKVCVCANSRDWNLRVKSVDYSSPCRANLVDVNIRGMAISRESGEIF